MRRPRGARPGHDDPALQPHPQRGRVALRPRQHHPRGAATSSRARSPQPATPVADDRRRDGRAAPITEADLWPSPGSGTSPSATTTSLCSVESHHLGGLLDLLSSRGIKTLTSAPPDARAAVHGAVPHRWQRLRPGGHRGGEVVMSGFTGTGALLRLAARRDRVLDPGQRPRARRPRRRVRPGDHRSLPDDPGSARCDGWHHHQPRACRDVRAAHEPHLGRVRGLQDDPAGRSLPLPARLHRRSPAHPHRGGGGAPRARRGGRRAVVGPRSPRPSCSAPSLSSSPRSSRSCLPSASDSTGLAPLHSASPG